MARFSPPQAYWHIRQRKRRARPFWVAAEAVGFYDFTNAIYSSGSVSVANASGGLVDDLAGNWSFAPPNTLRRSNKGLLIEPSRTNSIRNSTMQGAAAPSTDPTNWSNLTGTANGITGSVVGTGTEGALAYVDVRFQGTAVASAGRIIRFEPTTQIVAALGETWTVSSFWSLVAGSPGSSSVRAYVQEANAAGTTLANQQGGALLLTVGPLGARRCAVTRTLSNGSVARVAPSANLVFTAGETYDYTVRIGVPQAEIGAAASSPIPTTASAATRSADSVIVVLPAGTGSIRYTFDDDTTQTVSAAAGSYLIPIPARPSVRYLQALP